ncbi:MAG: ubiquinol-cytochrome c reductase iron-sulfur subunit [Bosea sp. (in: a-proteobacteria)]|uniref:ubiquinol-cytochrome c reductase iron-sulfur subunit n=2 Tax=Bosea TaxID=85413 RepID=UPI000856AA17|nr:MULTISPECIES: ubiquinol-cytochrome c reductase iron-sulfur subunit [unclassified Bosea (in: a-proteobacteria)]AOG05001.1 ubiquinol-cytochrome c reductase, iron-sulfur subunit [Bosea sp. RAC05]MCZ8043383.1 ubiquinol-cytochrome c reductase iron-sulfur subunit [Beijerinckiaceae bacterium]MDP3602954.1 ubiquinol-cytochrome c reductase iron-sulfur subunit [Bosea sp. (in: a-proteobacteria)]
MANATDTKPTESTRRDFLMLATGAAGVVGLGAVVVPLVSQLAPDAQTVAAGAPIDLDLAPIAEGQAIKLFWRGKLIFVRHRTKKEIDEARAVNVASLPDPQTDQARVKQGHEQFLVVYGNCTHLGCVPLGNNPGDPKGDYDGWFCPCHGSHYDSSGRIRKGPAPLNLPIPPYAFSADTKIRIG